MPVPKIRIAGIRKQIPSGYVMGRISQGGGDAELIPIADLATRLIAGGSVQSTARNIYLSGLADVDIASLSDGQVLTYNAAAGKWENETSATGSSTLAGDTDVAISSPTDGQALIYDSATSKWKNGAGGSTTLAADTDVSITSPADDDILVYNAAAAKWENEGFPIFIQKDCEDETTAITAATDKKTFRMPHAMVLSEVRASLTAAQATSGTGGIFTVDVKQNGVSIFSTLLTIDNTERTSVTAATAAVLATTQLYDDDEMRIDVTQIGDGTATGLKVTFIGTRSNAVVVTGGGPYFGPGYFATGYFGVYA